MTRAPITPGTHPTSVNTSTNNTDPHPLAITANGGKRIHTNTRKTPITFFSNYRAAYLVNYPKSDIPSQHDEKRNIRVPYLQHRLI
jgi:hypothetical protein